MQTAYPYTLVARPVGVAAATTSLAPAIAGGTMLAVALAMHVVPRGDWVYLVVLAGVLFGLLLNSGWRLADARLPTPTSIGLAGFGLIAILGELWGAVPERALFSGSAFIGMVGLGTLACDAIARLGGKTVRRAGFGLLIGFLVGLGFLVFECLTNFALLRLILDTVPGLIRASDKHLRLVKDHLAHIDPANIKRHMAQATLLLWPVALIALTNWRGMPGKAMSAGIIVATLIAGVLARHDSSNLALLTSLAAFLAANLSFRWTWRAVTLLWLVLTLLIVPIMLWQFSAKAYETEWLQQSGRHRLVIWGYSAGQVSKAPILGIGAGSGKAVDARRTDVKRVPGQPFEFRTADHQHDFYLQTWYEMGGLGAGTLCLAGLLALRRLARLPDSCRRYGLATFVAAMFLVSTSYGLWQEWFVASIAIAAVALTIAIRCASHDAFDLPRRPAI